MLEFNFEPLLSRKWRIYPKNSAIQLANIEEYLNKALHF